MNFSWTFLIDMSILGMALILATWMRSRIRFLQRFLVPNALTAGFILLPLYNWVFPLLGMSTMNLENIVYHFLNLSFIAMSLRISREKRRSNRDVFATSTMVVSQYAIQSLLGTILVLIMIGSFLPNLFPGFGLLATLGFSLGPGQAFAIGTGWDAMGFFGLGDVGLTFGAVGFLFSCFGGIFLINYGIKKGWVSEKEINRFNAANVRSGVLLRGEQGETSEVSNITNPEAIDPLSFSTGLILATYLLSYLILQGISWIIVNTLGTKGTLLVTNLWGIMFILCGITAILVKSILRKIGVAYVVDNQRMTRLSGFSVDFMVVSSVAAINITIVLQYWLPLLIISVAVGFVTTVSHIWFSSRVFQTNVFYRSILVYGAITGSLPTGLALLRIIDPQLETPASRDYMASAGISFLAVIPLFLTMNLPAHGALNKTLIPTYQVLALYALYLVLCMGAYFMLSGKRRFKDASSIWLRRAY